MAKYALMNGNKVDTVSYVPQEGFVEVADTVFADMVKDGSGNFDYSAERKAENQARIALLNSRFEGSSGPSDLAQDHRG